MVTSIEGRGVASWVPYGAVLAAAALIGLRQGAAALEPPCPQHAPCALALPRQMVIEGWVATEPVRRSGRLRFDLEVAAVHDGDRWQPLVGSIRIWARGLGEGWHEGSCLRARVRLRRPRNFNNPGAFDYVRYLRRHGISVTGSIWDERSVQGCERRRGQLREMLVAARQRIKAGIDAAVDERPAGVIRALVIGDRGGLSRSQRTLYARAGVAHILAISGLHLAVVSGAVFAVLRLILARSDTLLVRGLVPRLAALGALPLTLAYALLAGGRPPTLRAAIMISVYLVAVSWNRRSDLVRNLALAAIAVTIGWPGVVFDLSFGFSFLAVASIALGMRRFDTYWKARSLPGMPGPAASTSGRARDKGGLGPWSPDALPRRLARWALLSAVASFCAALGTAPLSAFHFNTISLAGPLANLIAVPLFSVAVVAALCGAAISLGSAALAVFPFWVAGALVHAGDVFVGIIAGFPGAAVRVVTPTVLELGISYAGLACIFASRERRVPFLAVVALLAAGDGLFWIQQRYARPDLRVTFLDIGQSEAAVVEFPGSAVLLVDGGGFPGSEFDPGEAVVAPFLWSRKIRRVDYVAMSHAEVDHMGGLPFLIREFRPREFWWNGRPRTGAGFERLESALSEGGVVVRELSRDTPPRMVGRVTVDVLHPPAGSNRSLSANDASLVLRLGWGITTVLFTGDIERAGEEHLLRLGTRALETSVLKVPHHGSLTSSGERFLDAVRPNVAIFSLGSGNRHGFPHAEVVSRYRDRGICIRRTDERGALVLRGNQEAYRIDPPCLGISSRNRTTR